MTNERMAELERLLQFALNELSYLRPEQDPDSDFDYCTSCFSPEWDHKAGCEAVQWEEDARKVLRNSIK